MRIWHFSETAYPHLPPEDDYESVRVSMPNRYYDPDIGYELYQNRIDEWCHADELGIDIMINEHHQTPTCVDPAAPIMTGVLARVTKNARLLILGNPIANRRQPVRVAEEMAMIDVMSKGRLECGFVRSVPYEIAPANSNPVRTTERMWEAHDLILKAWTSHDGPFTFEGEFFHHRMVNIWPRPYQQPHPPIWVTALSTGNATDIARKGYKLGTFLGGYEKTPPVFNAYRKAYREAGHGDEVPLENLGYSGLIFVGETEEEGRAGGQHLLWYLSHNKLPMHFKNPPGYASIDANVMALKGAQIGVRREGWVPDLDEEMAKGIVFCGTPDQVYDQLKKFYDHVGGFGNLLSMGQAGHLSHEDTKKSLTLLAKEVYPRLKELGKPTSIAAA
ncbi:MAG: LLM class flavin-dependent oxidoreductase [Alphaproteobacteria bacterium]|jgi:alkanesulfonate monooxygenase SsuD/methylene tetrahydromethanopterin reductase-like flavin-dependent oxidoreductase (luciferase family)